MRRTVPLTIFRGKNGKAGKNVEIAQTKSDNYHRWYRIKLPNTQSITFSGLNQ